MIEPGDLVPGEVAARVEQTGWDRPAPQIIVAIAEIVVIQINRKRRGIEQLDPVVRPAGRFQGINMLRVRHELVDQETGGRRRVWASR